MKNIIVWSLSILLGMEPAVFAAGSGNTANAKSVKSWIEQTQVTNHSVSLQEILKNSPDLPKEVRAQIETYLKDNKANPNFKLPKFAVSKYKDSTGNEIYKLQAVENGQAVDLEIVGRDDIFMKINGTSFSSADMRSFPTVVDKMKAPAARSSLLSAEQIAKLPHAQQVQYFKQLRQLLESMEAVQQSRGTVKTSQNDFNKWNAIVELLALSQTEAFAKPPQKSSSPKQDSDSDKDQSSGSDASCIAGGWAPQVVFDKATQRLKCGSDGSGSVKTDYRGSCGKNEFNCNPALYGSNSFCIPAARDTTARCNEKVGASKKDIPDVSQNRKEFDDLKNAANAQAMKLHEICGHAEEQKPGLKEDQVDTCVNFEARWETIKGWDCAKPDFASQYPKVCPADGGKDGGKSDGKVDGKPEAQTPGVVTTPAAPAAAKDAPCDKLPDNMSLTQKECAGGSAVLDGRCYAGAEKKEVYLCHCDNGGPVSGKMICAGSSANGDKSSGSSRHSKKSLEEKGFLEKYGLGIGLGIVGIMAYYFLNRSAVREQAKIVNPQPQNPPVAPPFTQPPQAPPAPPARATQ